MFSERVTVYSVLLASFNNAFSKQPFPSPLSQSPIFAASPKEIGESEKLAYTTCVVVAFSINP